MAIHPFLLCVQYPHLAESYQQLQLALSEAGAGLNASAANLVVASRGSNDMLAQAAKKFADDFLKMLNAAMAVAGAASVSFSWIRRIILLAQESLALDMLGNFGIVNLL